MQVVLAPVYPLVVQAVVVQVQPGPQAEIKGSAEHQAVLEYSILFLVWLPIMVVAAAEQVRMPMAEQVALVVLVAAVEEHQSTVALLLLRVSPIPAVAQDQTSTIWRVPRAVLVL
jgi:hypothetical protein